MKRIDTYILEKLHINKDVKNLYNYYPKNNKELIECIIERVKKEGLGTENNPLDLNDIYTGDIISMKNLFNRNNILYGLSVNGYCDISEWDVSNVRDMSNMFLGSNFNGDLSKWNVSSVTDMSYMFHQSQFTGENGDINKWKVENVQNMEEMFSESWFSGTINDWKVDPDTNTSNMFNNCLSGICPPRWYKTK